MVAVGLGRLFDLCLINLSEFRQFRHGRATLMDLLETIDLQIDLAQGSALVQRQAHNAALLGDGLEDALANPPYGIGDELESARFVKFLSSLYQSDVALVDEVGKRQALMLVLLGHGDDESEVGGDETLFCLLALGASLADGLGQLDFLLDGHEGLTTDLHEVLIQCFTRSVGNALLNL